MPLFMSSTQITILIPMKFLIVYAFACATAAAAAGYEDEPPKV
jgi:hypothetical protein